MASRLLTMQLRALAPRAPQGSASIYHLHKIGNRDIVGHGWNGQTVYADRLDYPLPAIRFKENTPDIMALREKEKCDWKKLTLEEKKALYRASFCQTYSEMKAPTGFWKVCVGYSCFAIAMALASMILMNLYVYDELPVTFSEERKKAQLERMLQLEVNPVTGLASTYDYENKKFK